MHVKVALLADYSNVSREGKLNILGIFDTIYAPTFPTTHPHMQLVIRFEGGVPMQAFAPDRARAIQLFALYAGLAAAVVLCLLATRPNGAVL